LQQIVPHRPRATSSSQGSSGTDTETRTLLTNSDKSKLASASGLAPNATLSVAASKGAIPKRRSSHGGGGGGVKKLDNEERRNSANSRVDSPLHFADDDFCDELDNNDDDAKVTHADVSKNYWRNRKNLRRRPPTPPTNAASTEGGTMDEATVDLRQRILEILSTSNNEDCERELSKLKKELDNRSRRSALVAVASSASNGLNDASTLSTTSVDESRFSSRRRSSGPRRRRHRANGADFGNSTSNNVGSSSRERRCRAHQRPADQPKSAVPDVLGKNQTLISLTLSHFFYLHPKYNLHNNLICLQ